MIVRWLRAFDGIEAGTLTWEPDGMGRVYVDHGYAEDTGLTRFPKAKDLRRVFPVDTGPAAARPSASKSEPASEPNRVLATPRPPEREPLTQSAVQALRADADGSRNPPQFGNETGDLDRACPAPRASEDRP